jgi:predicted outer membrane repeat protein
MPIIRILCLLLLAMAHLPSRAATFSAGALGDGACTHPSLDAALDAAAATAGGPHLVKVAFSSQLAESGDLIDLLSVANPLAAITVEGGYANCAASTPGATRSTVGFLPDQTGRVLRIDSSVARRTLTLRKLALTGGNSTSFPLPNAYGGAIRVAGNVDLVLDDVEVSDNRSVRGGAVAVLDGAVLEVRGRSNLSNNRAESTSGRGGGIYCSGTSTRVQLVEAVLLGNHSAGNGGAMYLDACQGLASVASTAAGFTAINLQNNTAGDAVGTTYGFGGAIFSRLTSIDLDQTSNAMHQTWFLGNQAHHGGAIYLEGASDATPVLSVSNGLFAYNVARGQGGAIHGLNQVEIYIDHARTTPCQFTGSFDGVETTVSGCSLLLGNRASNGGSTTTSGGGVVYLGFTTTPANPPLLWIDRSTLRFNQDDSFAAVAHASSGRIWITNSILADNRASGTEVSPPSLLRLPAPGPHLLQHSTVVDNDVEFVARVFSSEWDISASVLHSASTKVWFAAGSGSSVRHRGCLLRHPLEDTVPDEEVAPGFFSAGTLRSDPRLDADFRPRADSNAIDGCATSLVNRGADHDGLARGYDVAGVQNYFWSEQVGGTFTNDLGALERRDDALFADGFESD